MNDNDTLVQPGPLNLKWSVSATGYLTDEVTVGSLVLAKGTAVGIIDTPGLHPGEVMVTHTSRPLPFFIHESEVRREVQP